MPFVSPFATAHAHAAEAHFCVIRYVNFIIFISLIKRMSRSLTASGSAYLYQLGRMRRGDTLRQNESNSGNHKTPKSMKCALPAPGLSFCLFAMCVRHGCAPAMTSRRQAGPESESKRAKCIRTTRYERHKVISHARRVVTLCVCCWIFVCLRCGWAP